MFVGLVGMDQAAEELRRALCHAGVDDRWLVADAACRTMRKTRVLANDQYVIRVDDGETRCCSEHGLAEVQARVDQLFPCCDAIVVSDYGYGTVSEAVIDRLSEMRRHRPVVLTVDAKHPERFAQAGATIIAPDSGRRGRQSAWMVRLRPHSRLPPPSRLRATCSARLMRNTSRLRSLPTG